MRKVMSARNNLRSNMAFILSTWVAWFGKSCGEALIDVAGVLVGLKKR